MTRFLLAGLLLLVTPISSFAADKLPVPTGPVVLTMEGNITTTNAAAGKAAWDMDMLKSLGVLSFQTRTPWTEGNSTFEGVLVRDVMAAVGAAGTAVEAFALDGYSNEIPVTDFTDYNVILAFSMNGQPLDSEEKGPLWVMYPFDAHPKMDIEEKSAHAVWQLTRMVVR
ncbi:MAG: molybdopterin-dependent oxidoreductase [Rhodospirillales bacterium]|nr:molybdopterin-dependent oxidoreductase [Rhodospirillales bacterium]